MGKILLDLRTRKPPSVKLIPEVTSFASSPLLAFAVELFRRRPILPRVLPR